MVELSAFNQLGRSTVRLVATFRTPSGDMNIPVFLNEFWTAKQRAASRLHEIFYRACFKPQLPRFFILRLTRPGDRVLDPFMGRGTTLIEAALLGRVPIGCDINPLSILLARPRVQPPTEHEVRQRLKEIDFTQADEMPPDLLVFYHPETLQEICALRKYLSQRKARAELDAVDEWIWMDTLRAFSPFIHCRLTRPSRCGDSSS